MTRLMYRAVLACLGLLLAGITAPVSAVLYVDDDGICDGNTPCYVHLADAVQQANAGDSIVVHQGSTVVLDGSNSSDNVGVVDFVWSFVDQGNKKLDGESVSYTFSNAGEFEVTLTVSDAQGNIDSDVILISVVDVTFIL